MEPGSRRQVTDGAHVNRLRRIQPSRREKYRVSDAGTGVAHPSDLWSSLWVPQSAFGGECVNVSSVLCVLYLKVPSVLSCGRTARSWFCLQVACCECFTASVEADARLLVA